MVDWGSFQHYNWGRFQHLKVRFFKSVILATTLCLARDYGTINKLRHHNDNMFLSFECVRTSLNFLPISYIFYILNETSVLKV
jgi:hypothetical protein